MYRRAGALVGTGAGAVQGFHPDRRYGSRCTGASTGRLSRRSAGGHRSVDENAVPRLDVADPREHDDAKFFGSALPACALHHLGDGDAHAQLGTAVDAVLDVLPDVCRILAAQFVVRSRIVKTCS